MSHDDPAPATEPNAGTELLKRSFQRLSAAWLMLLFIVIFSIASPEVFPTLTTAKLVLSDQTTVAMLALAALIPLSAGAFDLSIGANLAFSAVIFSALSRDGHPFVVCVVAAVLGSVLAGFVNGFLVVKLGINSFIATLGMSELLSAGMMRMSSNQQITGVFPQWFQTVTSGTFLGITYNVYMLAALAFVVWYCLEHTGVGRTLFATGGNPEAARLAGVNTGAAVWWSLVASGLIAGLAGILLVSKNLIFTPDLGPAYLFPAFAAVFFGATQIKARANVWGTLLAVYALATGVSGVQLTFFDSDYWISPLFNGVALLGAVALATRQNNGRKPGRSARRVVARLGQRSKESVDA